MEHWVSSRFHLDFSAKIKDSVQIVATFHRRLSNWFRFWESDSLYRQLITDEEDYFVHQTVKCCCRVLCRKRFTYEEAFRLLFLFCALGCSLKKYFCLTFIYVKYLHQVLLEWIVINELSSWVYIKFNFRKINQTYKDNLT